MRDTGALPRRIRKCKYSAAAKSHCPPVTLCSSRCLPLDEPYPAFGAGGGLMLIDMAAMQIWVPAAASALASTRPMVAAGLATGREVPGCARAAHTRA